MKKLTSPKLSICTAVLLILLFTIGLSPSYSQVMEPEVREADKAETPVDKGYQNRIGGSVYLNNFGFGIGGTYTHALGRFTEITFSTGITGIRDVSEQTFTNYFTGRRLIPNKYKRALGFPFLFGIKQRMFANHISDNFRFYVAASAGPAMAFVYPYINDSDGNGYRTYDYRELQSGFVIKVPLEQKNGFFQGWGDGSTKWGGAGKIAVGVDLGSNYQRQSTLEIGFFFYYFDPGLQMMEPRRPVIGENGRPETDATGERINEDFFDAQKFFGTPQIKFTYSGWW